MDFALNNLQCLICPKTKPNQTKPICDGCNSDFSHCQKCLDQKNHLFKHLKNLKIFYTLLLFCFMAYQPLLFI